jgi:sterol desaturase/sphingolipid hydroxylase (fatty acid hydroxylase superfamily)
MTGFAMTKILDGFHMAEFLIDHELQFRQYAFYGCLIFLLFVEELFPKRQIRLSYKTRWTANFGLMLIYIVLLRIAIPWIGIELAFKLQQQQIGLFNRIPIPELAGLIVGIMILDGFKYMLHRLSHKLDFLWRLHRVHHTDVDFDVSTSVRHHPAEAIVGTLNECLVIAVFGLSPESLFIWAMTSSTIDLFNHANLRLPLILDSMLRWLLVTPDMHRIHHSAFQAETDSNFSSFLSFWDKLFGSYRAKPESSQQSMMIGLEHWRQPAEQSIFSLLLNPFFSKKDLE